MSKRARIVEATGRTIFMAGILAVLWAPGRIVPALWLLVGWLGYVVVRRVAPLPAMALSLPLGADEQLVRRLQAHDRWNGWMILLGLIASVGSVLTIFFRGYLVPLDKPIVIVMTILILLSWVSSFVRAHQRRMIFASVQQVP